MAHDRRPDRVESNAFSTALTELEQRVGGSLFPERAPDSHFRQVGYEVALSSAPDSVSPESLPPESSQAHQAEVRDGVLALVELQHAAILRIIGRLLMYVAAPLALVVFAHQVMTNSLTAFCALELFGSVVATWAARRRTMKLQLRRVLVCGGFVLAAVMTLCHFGPLMFTGLIYVAATLVSALLLTRRAAFAAAALLIASTAIVGGLNVWLPQLIPPPEGILLDSATWIRLVVTSAVAIGGVLYIFLQVQANLWRSLEKEIAMRLRERRLVAEREKVLRRAASAQRLESLGRLAGGLAHDFNNALVVIQCGIEAIADELDEVERGEVVEELSAGVDRAAATARQLLSFAKRNVEEIGECEPADVVNRLSKESRRLLPAHITLMTEIEEAPRVAVSGTALEQMILNLVQNARDALQEAGGTVTISTATEQTTGGLLLVVGDNGPGMTPEVAERVFEPFFTTKGDRGTGLGLATVWGMVQRHGGEVTLDTVPEKGTRVRLHLPAASATAVNEPVPLSEVAPSSGGYARVLVLEDEAPVRTALRRVLKHTGFTVVEAATVAEARQACRERKFSLLISDGVVPDGGVGTFIHEFRAQQQNAPVILCSGYLEEDLALDGIARGECAYLAKPFSPTDLISLIARLLPDVKPSVVNVRGKPNA